MNHLTAGELLVQFDKQLQKPDIKRLAITMQNYVTLEKWKERHQSNMDLVMDDSGYITYKGVPVRVK